MIEADLPSLRPSSFAEVLAPQHWRSFDESLQRGAELMEGRTLYHVNSTMTGGGVAELLGSVLGYLLGAEINSRWMVLEGTDDFFVLTKRIHHLLHGKEGDGEEIGPADYEVYESVLRAELPALVDKVKPGDVVVLHDPQVVGLAPPLRELGATVIWNCHVGADSPNEQSRQAWRFLLPAVREAHAQVFSRSVYAWEGLEECQVTVIPPCIDAFSPKNQKLSQNQVGEILARAGIAGESAADEATFVRIDGTLGRITHTSRVIEEQPLPVDAPLVMQVSRWDPLKDHAGVARSFADAVPLELGAHLVLAGPSPEAVADDPEGSETFEELRDCIASLPEGARARMHIACLPMEDIEENAAVVNALQRRSDVIVQKSLAEGFGLTVAEAMWKARPTVASAVGGIQDQIADGISGVLVDDPEDDAAFGVAISKLLSDRTGAAALGSAAQESVCDNFLAPKYLGRYLELIERVMVN